MKDEQKACGCIVGTRIITIKHCGGHGIPAPREETIEEAALGEVIDKYCTCESGGPCIIHSSFQARIDNVNKFIKEFPGGNARTSDLDVLHGTYLSRILERSVPDEPDQELELLCHRCGGEIEELDSETLCACCKGCAHECAMDI